MQIQRLVRKEYHSTGNSGGSVDEGTAGSPAPEPSYDVSTGNAIVDRAYGWVGRAEYVWGACSPGAFDCSGFVSYCLTGSYSLFLNNIYISRMAESQRSAAGRCGCK